MGVFGSSFLIARLHKTFASVTLFIGWLHKQNNVELILTKSGTLRELKKKTYKSVREHTEN